MGHMVCMHVCKVASCITDTQLETYESNASTNPSKTRNPKMKSGSWASLGRVLGELGESWEEFEGEAGGCLGRVWGETRCRLDVD